MYPTKSQEKTTRSSSPAPPTISRALEWLWQHLRDIRNPHVLDCGAVHKSTMDVLLRRGAKLYVADLTSSKSRMKPEFWDRSGKAPRFLVDAFLAQLPSVPADSLTAIFCWHLFDLVPREAQQPLLARLFSYLQTNGALFCLLREPKLLVGAETIWWLESLTVLGSGEESDKQFTYPVLTNRDIEKMVPNGNFKIFLTRTGRREVLAIKQ